jgi:hypothetical protein
MCNVLIATNQALKYIASSNDEICRDIIFLHFYEWLCALSQGDGRQQSQDGAHVCRDTTRGHTDDLINKAVADITDIGLAVHTLRDLGAAAVDIFA